MMVFIHDFLEFSLFPMRYEVPFCSMEINNIVLMRIVLQPEFAPGFFTITDEFTKYPSTVCHFAICIDAVAPFHRNYSSWPVGSSVHFDFDKPVYNSCLVDKNSCLRSITRSIEPIGCLLWVGNGYQTNCHSRASMHSTAPLWMSYCKETPLLLSDAISQLTLSRSLCSTGQCIPVYALIDKWLVSRFFGVFILITGLFPLREPSGPFSLTFQYNR